MNPPDILEAVADELEFNGHLKGYVGEVDGPKCILGAFNFVLTGETQSQCGGSLLNRPRDWGEAGYNAWLSLDQYICGPDSEYYGLIYWNNHQDIDGHDVIDACRRTAKDLRNNE